jgi:pyruvate formate lyase activating enzyme
MVFDVQRYSTHDGPGIRTCVFFKGCTLRCKWCMNPEGIAFGPELMYDPDPCILCGQCAAQAARSDGAVHIEDSHVEIDRRRLTDARSYEDVCPTGALRVVGEEWDAEQLVELVLKDRLFYDKSDGGVTVGGGEPFAQPELLREFLRRLKEEGVSTSVETSMHVPWENIEQGLPYIDLLLSDVKHTDAERYRQGTRGDLTRVQRNYAALADFGGRVVARVPVIPGFNAAKAELQSIVDYVVELGYIREIDFLPFHTYGLSKYRQLGRDYEWTTETIDEAAVVEPAVAYARSRGLTASIGG